jgi:hypothetical protein
MQKEHKIFGEIRSARERGAQVEALQCFLELAPEQRADYAAVLSLLPEQLDEIEQAVDYLAYVLPRARSGQDPKAVELALWLLDKQPAAWASRCEQALREVLESLEGWQLVHEAEHVGHYVLETEDMGELDEEPVALAWGERESRWFEPCGAEGFGLVKQVMIERDEWTRQVVVALPCNGVWCVWKQTGWAALDAARS